MMPRVCMLIYNYWPGLEGGTERQCRRLSFALAERGARCTVLAARPHRRVPADEKDGLVRIVRVPTLDSFLRAPHQNVMGGRSFPTPARAARRRPAVVAVSIADKFFVWMNALFFQVAAACYLLSNARSFDLLHVHTSEWIAGFAVWIGRRAGLPVLCKVATMPALPESPVCVPFGRAWARLRSRANFVALNEAMAAELRTAGVSSERICVIPNSVEPTDLAQRREEPLLVLYVGNLSQHAYKAFDVLFEAWTRVHANEPHARLAVLGGGDAAPWTRFLQERGCRDSVVFEGFVREIHSFYRRAALLALPSRQEGMSNALIEAQSWGVPAVVSGIPANRAVIEHGINGLVVPVNDAAALADGLLHLLRDGRLRAEMGARARCMSTERYALARVAGLTLEAYENLSRAHAGTRTTKGTT
jgi:glycosyltransferase involved in cell wall biosynthesis